MAGIKDGESQGEIGRAGEPRAERKAAPRSAAAPGKGGRQRFANQQTFKWIAQALVVALGEGKAARLVKVISWRGEFFQPIARFDDCPVAARRASAQKGQERGLIIRLKDH